MEYKELAAKFREHERNRDYNTKPLVGYIVFTKDSFDKEYPEEARTYKVYSDCKAYMPNMGGYSIFGSSLDGVDVNVRLERYMAEERGGAKGWKVERCYLKEGTE